MPTYILYHANCLDGFGAAYAAWKRFGNSAQYIPVQYQQDPPEMELNSEIYIVDFSYPLETLQKLQSLHKKVCVLDHHVTAKEALLSYKDSIFDLNKSGAVITWEYFHPDMQVPWLLQAVQDRDLWQFKFEDTKAITAALWVGNKTFKFWDDLIGWDDPDQQFKNVQNLIQVGNYLLKQQDQIVEHQAKNSYKKTLPNRRTLWVTNTANFPSETCQAIMTLREVNIAATWYETSEGIIYSFRSKNDEDAGELAKELGGGGHRHASGAMIKN